MQLPLVIQKPVQQTISDNSRLLGNGGNVNRNQSNRIVCQPCAGCRAGSNLITMMWWLTPRLGEFSAGVKACKPSLITSIVLNHAILSASNFNFVRE